MMSYSSCFDCYSNKLFQIEPIKQADTGRSHRCSAASSLQLRIWNFVPIGGIFINYTESFHACLSRSSSSHTLRALFVFLGNSAGNYLNIIFGTALSQALGSGNMHHSVIRITPIEVESQSEGSLPIGNSHHIFVNQDAAIVELPGAIFISHGIACGCEQHTSLILFFFRYLA